MVRVGGDGRVHGCDGRGASPRLAGLDELLANRFPMIIRDGYH